MMEGGNACELMAQIGEGFSQMYDYWAFERGHELWCFVLYCMKYVLDTNMYMCEEKMTWGADTLQFIYYNVSNMYFRLHPSKPSSAVLAGQRMTCRNFSERARGHRGAN